LPTPGTAASTISASPPPARSGPTRSESDRAPGLHGHGLLGVSVGDLTLTPGQANRIPASSNVTFTVKVANQGDNPETDVRVRVRIRGAGDPISVQKVIDQTMPKTETTVSIPLGESPPIGEAVTLTVEVLPVGGEKNTSNNSSSYPALFVRS
jgi:hypothetical protein